VGWVFLKKPGVSWILSEQDACLRILLPLIIRVMNTIGWEPLCLCCIVITEIECNLVLLCWCTVVPSCRMSSNWRRLLPHCRVLARSLSSSPIGLAFSKLAQDRVRWWLVHCRMGCWHLVQQRRVWHGGQPTQYPRWCAECNNSSGPVPVYQILIIEY